MWDPIETPNRFIFAINRTVDMIAVRPLAVMYRDGVPEPAHELAHQGRIVARGDEAKARELGLAEALQKARFDQEFQMA